MSDGQAPLHPESKPVHAMKTTSARNARRHELLREFFACAVVLAAIKTSEPASNASAKAPYSRS